MIYIKNVEISIDPNSKLPTLESTQCWVIVCHFGCFMFDELDLTIRTLYLGKVLGLWSVKELANELHTNIAVSESEFDIKPGDNRFGPNKFSELGFRHIWRRRTFHHGSGDFQRSRRANISDNNRFR